MSRPAALLCLSRCWLQIREIGRILLTNYFPQSSAVAQNSALKRVRAADEPRWLQQRRR